jgi:RimJ/RimL family protein N-acetyltransferase
VQLSDQPIINIVGEKVALGPDRREILPLMYRWLNDFEVSILSGDLVRPVTMESLEAEYERDSKNEHRDWVSFIIYERATMRIIGITDLRKIEMRSRTATFGILIGEKDCWNKGYGTETTALMLDYGFTALGLHNIMLDTYSYHEAAIRAYTRAGFHMIGRRREVHRWGDRVYDEVMMDCLSTEFQHPAKPVLNLP